MMEGTQDPQDPQDPREAGRPSTAGPTRTYETDEIRVLWDATRCIHVATCLNALPEVFDVRRRPWIDVNAAPADRVAAAVRLCPTGALRYEAKSNVDPETPPSVTTVELRTNGPLIIRGRVRITNGRGEVISDESRVALCRCGASKNKPFCDNSHRVIGFRG